VTSGGSYPGDGCQMARGLWGLETSIYPYSVMFGVQMRVWDPMTRVPAHETAPQDERPNGSDGAADAVLHLPFRTVRRDGATSVCKCL